VLHCEVSRGAALIYFASRLTELDANGCGGEIVFGGGTIVRLPWGVRPKSIWTTRVSV
jgi:hypothetical protein